jgi:hypothetical protein
LLAANAKNQVMRLLLIIYDSGYLCDSKFTNKDRHIADWFFNEVKAEERILNMYRIHKHNKINTNQRLRKTLNVYSESLIDAATTFAITSLF